MLKTLQKLLIWLAGQMPVPVRKRVLVRARRPMNNSGQAAVEFMLIVVVFFFFLFLLLSLSILMVISEYVEFATFMAARTYKAGFSREEVQRENAAIVFNKYFENIQGIARKPKIEFRRADGNDENTAGVAVSYEIDVFYMPPLFGEGGTAPVSKLPLVSEAYLGRDPSFDEVCNAQAGGYFINFLNQLGVQNSDQVADQMDDNGC